MSKEVEAFENKMAYYSDCQYAVFVSSGSTANTILAMYLKDKVYTPEKNIIVVPSTTWTTSISPFVREGFKPHFIDIDLFNLSMDLNLLEKYLVRNHNKVACVFITSLLGFSIDVNRLLEIQDKYNVRVMLDNCESTFTRSYAERRILSHYFTSTTSTYFGHHLQSVEGGFLFTNNPDERDYFLMARNHGMVRSVNEKNKPLYANPKVDPRFDFHSLGNNFRNTDINAFIGQLDFERIEDYVKHRVHIYKHIESKIDLEKLYLPTCTKDSSVPFAIPVIFKDDERYGWYKKAAALKWCEENGIETRPIISGNLLKQTCYKKYGRASRFPVSEILHNNGFYVGLNTKTTIKNVDTLVNYINSL
jgi:CDP-6-deoxy-D-xylo-4-hexulose-3-dehydrase